MQCSFCGHEITQEKKNHINDTFNKFVANEKIELLAMLQERIVSANAGEPSPTEWKVLGIIESIIKELEDIYAI